MGFELPDYSYGLADGILSTLDYLIRVGTDTGDGEAMKRLEDARDMILDYKDLISEQVME